jgi:hypothetical protein
VLLLGEGGATVFLGPTSAALPYFTTQLGFQIPPFENPADFFLDVISAKVALKLLYLLLFSHTLSSPRLDDHSIFPLLSFNCFVRFLQHHPPVHLLAPYPLRLYFTKRYLSKRVVQKQ